MSCFNPNLGQIWTNPNVGLKMQLKNVQLKVENVLLGVCPCLTQIWVNWYSFEYGNRITIKIFHKNDHSKAMFFGHGTIVLWYTCFVWWTGVK